MRLGLGGRGHDARGVGVRKTWAVRPLYRKVTTNGCTIVVSYAKLTLDGINFTIYDELWDIDGSERTANIEGDADL